MKANISKYAYIDYFKLDRLGVVDFFELWDVLQEMSDEEEAAIKNKNG